MVARAKRSVFRSTILYGFFALLMVWLIYFQEFTLGDLGSFLPMPEQMARMSLDTLLIPTLASVSIFYAASLVGTAFEGALAEVLVGTLYAAGFASFFALFLVLNPGPQINRAGYLLSTAFAVLLVYNVVSTIARLKKKTSLRAVAISAIIYLEGQIVVRLISLLIESSGASMPPELAAAIGDFINLGITIAAVFTIFAVFKNSRNPYLSALGGISGNYLFSVSLSLIGALYYGFFLGGMSTFAPSISNLSPYVEWTGICVFAALIFTIMRRGMQGSIMVKNKLGDWKKHLQQITTYKGDRFVGFTEIIDDFVERGNRERLLVRLALFLHENRVGDDEISSLLAEIVNYEDEKMPLISRRGRTSTIENENLVRRLDVLQRTITRIVPRGTQGTALPTVSGDKGSQLAPPTRSE